MSKINTTVDVLLKKGIPLQDYLNCEIHHSESELLIDKNGILYKIFNEYTLHKKNQIMNFLYSNLKKYNSDILDLYIENNLVFAYSRNFYEGETLNELLKEDISLQEKKLF